MNRPAVEKNLSVVQLDMIDMSPEDPFLHHLFLMGVGEKEDRLNITEGKKNLNSDDDCFLLNLSLSLNWFYL